MQTVTLWDKSLEASLADGYKYGQKVRFFRASPAELPPFYAHGDVLILRDVGSIKRNGEIILTANKNARWIIFPAATLATLRGRPTEITQSDYKTDLDRAPDSQDYGSAFDLYRQWKSSGNNAGLHTPLDGPSPLVAKVEGGSGKFCLIQDVIEKKFCDLVVHVVKVQNDGNGIMNIHVSDYSPKESRDLYNHKDPDTTEDGDMPDYEGYEIGKANDGFKRPFGRRTLQISVFPPHSTYALQHLAQGSYALLENVQIKRHEEYLEGYIRGDRRFPDRIYIKVLSRDSDDPQLLETFQRRRDYWKQHELRSKKGSMQKMGLNPKRKAEPEIPEQRPTKKIQKAEPEILEKRQKKKSQKAQKHEQANQKPSGPAAKTGEQRIICSHQNTEITPLSTIIFGAQNHHKFAGIDTQLPFHNVNYRAKVLIVDFFPPDIADFAVKVRDRQRDSLSESDNDNASDPGRDVTANMTASSLDRWEWRFGFRLEDASGKEPAPGKGKARPSLLVWVNNADAQSLLDMDALELKKCERKLKTLRETLFLLWGDLEERKAGLSPGRRASGERPEPNHFPFECCIREYGVRTEVGGAADESTLGTWQRHFQMHGVVVRP